MNTFLSVMVVIITSAVTVLVVYLIQVLVELKKMLQSSDILIKKVTEEVESLDETVQTVSNITRSISKIGTPAVGVFGLLAGLLKGVSIIKGKKRKERVGE